MNTPLHLAVIEGDEVTVKQLADSKEFLTTRNELGFTPLELAQLLGRKQCQSLLGGEGTKTIKVQLRKKGIQEIRVDAFEEIFRITHRSFLTFPSYSLLQKTIQNCPYILRSKWLASENYIWSSQYLAFVRAGITASIFIRWIDPTLGYGVFANQLIPQGTFIGEYTGIVRRLFRNHPDHNAYCFHYPTRFWSFHYFTVDALYEGNAMRFVNHSEEANLTPLCLIDRGLLHLVFVANQDIPERTQLTLNYGEDYWQKRLGRVALID